MAQASLSSSELGADLSAWLAKITARLSGSTAPSRAVDIRVVPGPPCYSEKFMIHCVYREKAVQATAHADQVQLEYLITHLNCLVGIVLCISSFFWLPYPNLIIGLSVLLK